MRQWGTKASVAVVAVAWGARVWAGSTAAPVALPWWSPLMDALAAGLASALCLGAGSRAGDRRARVAWGLQALANGLWVPAALGVMLTPGHRLEHPLLVAARFGYLGLVACGFVLTSRGPDPRARIRMMLDGVAVAVSGFLVGWAVVFAPMLRSDDPRAPQVAAAMAFPLIGVTLVSFSVVLAFTEFAPGRRGMPLRFAAGLAAITVADAGAAGLRVLGHPVDAFATGGWTAGLVLVGLAARSYRGTTACRAEFVAARWIISTPYAVLAVAGAVVAVQVLRSGALRYPEALAMTALGVVVLLRQLLLLTQNRSLVLELADRHRDLSHAALHDSLTGLGNRELLMTRMDDVLHHRPHGPPPLSLLLCDLDDFKRVNDTLGHQAGDELLVQVAARLRSGVRTGDTVVRLGGDEFAVLLEAATDDALAVARGLRLAFQEPFALAGHQLRLTASIGVVHLPGTVSQATGGQLLRSADLAMYEAKRRGKNDVQVFRPGLDIGPAGPVDLRAELGHALDAGAVAVTFQPLVRVTDGEVVGAEALPRWDHPAFGAIDVPDLVAAAGRGRLVTRLTEVVLCTATTASRTWPPGTAVHVNVCAAQLADPRLVDRLHRALVTSGLSPGRLVVEVAETTVQKDVTGTASVLREIDGLGCRVAIDDFGGGQCALGLIAALPVALVKLDRALVHDLPRHRELVRAVVGFARSRGAQVAAGAVEHQKQWEQAAELGCAFVQGPLAGGPVRADQVARTAGSRSA